MISRIPLLNKLVLLSKKVRFFGIKEVSLYQIIHIYTTGIQKATIGNKAAAISWRLFLGMFPFLLFFLVLLQYMPHYEIIEKYIYDSLLEQLLPPSLVETSSQYFSQRSKEIAESSKGSVFIVILISILFYLYFATNGTISLINGLKSHNLEPNKPRSMLKQYGVALMLTVFFAVLMLSALILLYYTEIIWRLMAESNLLKEYNLINIGILKFLFFIIIFFIAVSALYYKGPRNKFTYKEIIPGTLFTTFLFILVTYVFGYIVTNFGRYNLLYGSVGSIMVLMITIYIDVILILLGYELNITLKKAKSH